MDKSTEFWANVHRNNDRKNIFFNKSRIVPISVSNIKLVEAVHIKDNKQYNNKPLPVHPIVVRYERGKFILISGIQAYKIALRENVETLSGIVFKGNRRQFLKAVGIESTKVTPKYQIVNLDKIKVSSNFAEHPPKQSKLDGIEAFYLKHNRLDKPVSLNNLNYLADGYARYLIAKKYGLKEIHVEYVVTIKK